MLNSVTEGPKFKLQSKIQGKQDQNLLNSLKQTFKKSLKKLCQCVNPFTDDQSDVKATGGGLVDRPRMGAVAVHHGTCGSAICNRHVELL